MDLQASRRRFSRTTPVGTQRLRPRIDARASEGRPARLTASSSNPGAPILSRTAPLCLLAAALALPASLPAAPAAALELHPSLGDHAVLQRDRPVPVRGRARPGSRVEAALLSPGGPVASAAARAGADGSFRVELPPQPAGGPFRIRVTEADASGATTATRRLDDLLFGELWLASGQSNMGWRVQRTDGQAAVVAEEIEGIRHLQVEQHAAPEPVAAPPAAWRRTEPAWTRDFSATAHHFARHLHAATGVPVGIIHASWGNTPAAAWTPRAALASDPVTRPLVQGGGPEARAAEAHARALAAWEAAYAPGGARSHRHRDPVPPGEREAEAARYAAEGFDDAGWARVDLPLPFEKAAAEPGDVDGVGWFRREVALPDALRGRALTLGLGRVAGSEDVYVDGVRVGSTPQSAAASGRPTERSHAVPAGLTEDGRLLLAVRLLNDHGRGGFAGPADRIRLTAEGDPGAGLGVARGWRGRVTEPLEPLDRPRVDPPARPNADANAQDRPGFLWNGMISGFAGTPVRGVIWYQGERDAGQAERYRTLFPLLIRSWREGLGDPDLPFLFVQLAPYQGALGEIFREGGWGPIRDAQAHAAATVPGVGMAVIVDLKDDNPGDIHPGNKQDVGERLALLARRGVYGESVAAEGPRARAVGQDGGAVRVVFASTHPPLTTADGQPPQEFWLRDAGGRTARADAEIDGDAVVLTAEGVGDPVEVLYAWASNPERVNLTDASGLPAAPFRLKVP